MAKKLKIVSIASEVAPFSKTGGLADVTRSLPKAIKRLGHEVITITPLYDQVVNKKEHNLKLVYKDVSLYLNSKDKVVVNYWKGYAMHDLPVYFVECKKYFSKRKTLYGSNHENARFMLFNVAALKLISILKFEADIVHCHDWQTGLIPFYLKTQFRYSKTLKKAKTIFTTHNLIFQFGRNWWEIPADKKDFGRSRLPHLDNPEIEYINFAKRGILSADAISTVSETYRDEIMTRKFGQDLHRVLKNRKDRLFGIVNGIDYKAYNSENDPGLHKHFNYKTIEAKQKNKEHLQKLFGLEVNKNIPMICMTSRVSYQKGFELLFGILEHLLILNVQFVVMGDGDSKYIKFLKKLNKKYPKKIFWCPYNIPDKSFKKGKIFEKYETLTYAGSDFLLLPSNHEPCGLPQIIAMRYGCIPIVRKIGGLHDTVTNFKPSSGEGNGFSFERESKYSLYGAIIRGLETYKHKKIWNNIIIQAMKSSNSWEIQAKKYVSLYRKVIRMKQKK